MKLSKRQIAIVALILTLASTNVALAAVYMNRDVMITGGVASSGTIEIYEEDGQTIMNSIAYPLFQGSTNTYNHFFWVKNIGNLPVAVYWNISNANPSSWSIESGAQAYIFTENSQTKYRFVINDKILPDGSQGSGVWNPDPTGTQAVTLGVGQGAEYSIDLLHYTTVSTPGTFSFVLSFYARSP